MILHRIFSVFVSILLLSSSQLFSFSSSLVTFRYLDKSFTIFSQKNFHSLNNFFFLFLYIPTLCLPLLFIFIWFISIKMNWGGKRNAIDRNDSSNSKMMPFFVKCFLKNPRDWKLRKSNVVNGCKQKLKAHYNEVIFDEFAFRSIFIFFSLPFTSFSYYSSNRFTFIVNVRTLLSALHWL